MLLGRKIVLLGRKIVLLGRRGEQPSVLQVSRRGGEHLLLLLVLIELLLRHHLVRERSVVSNEGIAHSRKLIEVVEHVGVRPLLVGGLLLVRDVGLVLF